MKNSTVNVKGKIILVNPSLSYLDKPLPEPVYPFAALMVFTTMLKQAGYDVVFIDGNRSYLKETIEEIKAEINDNVIFVGFSVMTCQVPWVDKAMKVLKEHSPEVKIVLGGFHPSIYPEQTIQDGNVDIIAINEFFHSIELLAETLDNDGDLEKVPGLMFEREGEIIKTKPAEEDDIHKIPLIDYNNFDLDYYKTNNYVAVHAGAPDMKAGFILSGFGCYYKCNFCYNSILGRKYRFRSAEEVVDRIEYLQKEHGITFFQILEDDFFGNKKRILEFIRLIEERNLKFYFRPWGRANHFKDHYLNVDLLKRLKKIGMVNMSIGAESGSDRTLKMINKKATVEQNENAIRNLYMAGIMPRATFMVGLPGEKEQDILKTFQFVIRLQKQYKNFDAEILGFTAYPGSPLYLEAVKNYTLEVPESFAEWAEMNYAQEDSVGAYFFNSQEKPWLENPVKYDLLMQYFWLIKIIEQFSSTKRLNKFLLAPFKSLVCFRFKQDFFSFPFELSLQNMAYRYKDTVKKWLS